MVSHPDISGPAEGEGLGGFIPHQIFWKLYSYWEKVFSDLPLSVTGPPPPTSTVAILSLYFDLKKHLMYRYNNRNHMPHSVKSPQLSIYKKLFQKHIIFVLLL